MTTVVVPWSETILDPFGNEQIVTVNLTVPVSDIWNWHRAYTNTAGQDNMSSNPKSLSDLFPPGTNSACSDEKGHQLRKGTARRLTGIEKCRDKAKRLTSIGALVDKLKSCSKEERRELVELNLDRFRNLLEFDTTDDIKKYIKVLVNAS